jgi:type I restriction enzyme, S subunit
MTEWPMVDLKDAPLEIIDGDRGANYPHQDEFQSSGHCLFLNAGNVTAEGFNFSDCAFIAKEKDDLLRKGKLVRNDIVLTTRGTVGNVAFFDEKIPFENVRINSGMVIIRANSKVLNPRFLYLFIKSNLFGRQASALKSGSAQPQLPIKDIVRIKLPLPPLPKQCAIAAILGALDDKAEISLRTNVTLETMASTIFKDWFVNFGPTRAKINGAPPYLSSSIWGLFPSALEKSDAEPIPVGWSNGSFGKLFARITERVGTRNISVLSAVSSGKLVKSDDHFTKRVYSKDTKNYLAVTQWDFAYNPSRINIGSVGMLEENIFGGVSPVYIVARPEPAYRWYLHFLMRRQSTKAHINALSSGSVRQSLSYSDFASIPCTIPPDLLTREFDRIWERIRVSIKANESEKTVLNNLRDLLLPKLMSGELLVENAQKFIETRI